VDDPETVRKFAESIGASYPLLSDATHEVSKAYGVLDPSGRVDRRVTFVVDSSGIIRKVEEGSAAVEPGGVVTFCKRIERKAPGGRAGQSVK
jgi:peroxiredoxin